jgi:hypothetical protein
LDDVLDSWYVLALLLFSEIEHVEECAGNLLVLEVWADDDTKEWFAFLVKTLLVVVVVKQVCYRRVNVKFRMAVVPAKLGHTIFFHHIGYINHFYIRYLTINFPLVIWVVSAWFSRVNFANDNVNNLLLDSIPVDKSFIVSTS